MSFDWRKLGHFDLSLPSPWSSLTTPEKTHIQTVRRTFFHNCCLKMSIWIMEDTDYYTTSSKFMWMTSFTVSEGVERKWLLILFPAAAPYVPHVYAADFSSAGLPSVSNACVCVCVGASSHRSCCRSDLFTFLRQTERWRSGCHLFLLFLSSLPSQLSPLLSVKFQRRTCKRESHRWSWTHTHVHTGDSGAQGGVKPSAGCRQTHGQT